MAEYGIIILASLLLVTSAVVALLLLSNSRYLQNFIDPVIPDREIQNVEPDFVNGTAMVNLSKDQASGPVTVNAVYAETVDVDFIVPHAVEVETVPQSFAVEDSYSSCAGKATLLGISSEHHATFEITKGTQCPICWHVFPTAY